MANKNLLSDTPKSPMAKVKRLVELKAIMKEIKPEIDALTADLLKVTQDLDVYTLKTGEYTISRAKRVTPRVTNFGELKKAMDEADIPYETTETFAPFMKTVFQRMVEEGKLLPGLDGLETEYISIRVKEKKTENENENA